MKVLQSQYPISPLVQTLEISRSGFEADQLKSQRPRRQQDQHLSALLVEEFAQSRQTYGAPRLQVMLRRRGHRCGKNRIHRLMHQAGLEPRQKRRFRPRTTQADPARPVADNWLAQFPSPERPDQVWLSDITYLHTHQGLIYLAATVDGCSRKCVGWNVDDCLATTPLVSGAWDRAQQQRRPEPGLLHHSDRGTQYTSEAFQQRLRQAHATPSMSRPACPHDNAMMESFFATLKTEALGSYIPASLEETKTLLFDYIETFYNPRRIHSALGYRSPADFEKQCFSPKTVFSSAPLSLPGEQNGLKPILESRFSQDEPMDGLGTSGQALSDIRPVVTPLAPKAFKTKLERSLDPTDQPQLPKRADKNNPSTSLDNKN